MYIVSLARDCESVTPYSLARLGRLSEFFKTSHIHIYENDSIDNTPKLLKEWESQGKNRRAFCEQLDWPRGEQDYSLDRRRRMAYMRNKYMDNNMLSDTDYTIIYDFDILGGASYHGILNSLGQDIDWSCIASNSLYYRGTHEETQRVYYDTWALRLMDDDGERFYSQEKSERLNKCYWNRGWPLVEVKSAFGGLGMYKSRTLIGLRYDSYDIEHVCLHEQIRDMGGKIYLSPSMITCYNSTYFSPELGWCDPL